MHSLDFTSCGWLSTRKGGWCYFTLQCTGPWSITAPSSGRAALPYQAVNSAFPWSLPHTTALPPGLAQEGMDAADMGREEGTAGVLGAFREEAAMV